jgi:LysR family hydrogen peroxide-inducible transcriptional activator
MNIRDLSTGWRLRSCSISGAAERCHVSQPTLSMQIRKLEDYLGVPLFERAGRKVLVSLRASRSCARARSGDYEELHGAPARDPVRPVPARVFPTLAPYFCPHRPRSTPSCRASG